MTSIILGAISQIGFKVGFHIEDQRLSLQVILTFLKISRVSYGLQLDIHGWYKGIHESSFQANKYHLKSRINICLEIKFKLITFLVYGFSYHYARTFHMKKLESSYLKSTHGFRFKAIGIRIF